MLDLTGRSAASKPYLEGATVIGLGAPLALIGGAEALALAEAGSLTAGGTAAYGVRFMRIRMRAAGLTICRNGQRIFGVDWHKFTTRAGQAMNRIHYHRRPGIGWHRPWEGGW
jgi:hypothetical protein